MRQRSFGAITIATLAVVFVLTALSPVLLAWASSSRNDDDWTRLSSVGQAYGAVSAVLAGLALVAVAASLVLQARQLRISQLQTARSFQLELLRTAYEHPDLQAGWSKSIDLPYPQWRLHTYTNVIFGYLQMGYDMELFTDASVERMLTNRFTTTEGRTYWTHARAGWVTDANGRRQRRFIDIADRAYERALESAPVPDDASVATADGTRS